MKNLLAETNLFVESIRAFEPLYASLRLILILLPLGIFIFLIIIGALMTKFGFNNSDTEKIKYGKKILKIVIIAASLWFLLIIGLEILFAIISTIQ